MRTRKEEDIKVRVTPQMKSQLEAIANEREVSISSICREAIKEYLKRLGITMAQNPKTVSLDQTKEILDKNRRSKGASK